jgi:hypothetical protein
MYHESRLAFWRSECQLAYRQMPLQLPEIDEWKSACNRGPLPQCSANAWAICIADG